MWRIYTERTPIAVKGVCYSEKEEACIGFGTSVETQDFRCIDCIDEFAIATLGNGFWENCDEFKEGLEKVKKILLRDKNIDLGEALFEVFGHFYLDFCYQEKPDEVIEELVYPKAYPNGDINYNDVYAQHEALVLSNIDKTFAESYTEIRALDTEKKIDGYKKIEWKERAITIVEEIYIARCRYVEEMIEKFVEISTWHYGTNEQNLSILWYGLEGEKPISKWTITYGQPLNNMWFEEEHWFLLEDLVDGCDDCFATWYIDECATSLPYMSAILKECPIAFEKNDSIEDINKKMDEYFSKKK